MATARDAIGALAALAIALGAGSARADEEPASGEEGESVDLTYRRREASHPLRCTLEELVVLGVGLAEYALDKSANTRDWDLGYDWPSFRSKLLFDAVAFDNNHFATNWVTHQLAGYFYYGLARGCRLPVLTSTAYAVLSSTIWEYVGEIREQASVNDLIATPMSGVAIGEPMLHLGALFQRARPSPVSTALAWLFGSPKMGNDLVDGAEASEPPSYDALGLPDDVHHRFRLASAAGVTIQDRGPARVDARGSLDARIVTLPYYGKHGRAQRWFDEGEVSSMGLTFTGGSEGRLTDVVLTANAVLAGYYDHDDDARRGRTTIAGLRVGYEYGMHDYDRDRRRAHDRLASVDAGLSFEQTLREGSFAARLQLDALADFAGVDAYALPDYARGHTLEGLPSVLRNEGYYHGGGGTLRGGAALSWGPLEVGGDARADLFEAIHALDRDAGPGDLVRAADRRFTGRAWLGVQPGAHIRLDLAVERRERSGSIGAVHASRGETSFFGGAALLF